MIKLIANGGAAVMRVDSEVSAKNLESMGWVRVPEPEPEKPKAKKGAGKHGGTEKANPDGK